MLDHVGAELSGFIALAPELRILGAPERHQGRTDAARSRCGSEAVAFADRLDDGTAVACSAFSRSARLSHAGERSAFLDRQKSLATRATGRRYRPVGGAVTEIKGSAELPV